MPFQPERLRQLLKQRGMKNYELAEKLQITPAMISAYLAGAKAPSDDTRERMAEVLSTTEAYLLGEANIKRGPEVIGRVRPVPLIGRISAGPGLVAIEEQETLVVLPDEFMDPNKDYYLLRVEGESMNVDDIHDGMLVLVERTEVIEKPEIGVFLINGDDAILARREIDGNRVLLKKSNPEFDTLSLDPGDCRLLGVARKKISNI